MESAKMIRVRYFVLLAVFVSLLSGCAGSGGATLKIEAQHVVGRQHMPDELTDMLRDLGYDWIPISDPNFVSPVKTAQQDGDYRMRFEFVETKQVRIDARIRRLDGFTRLHFYEPGSPTLSASSKQLLQKLERRAVMEFGQANVSR